MDNVLKIVDQVTGPVHAHMAQFLPHGANIIKHVVPYMTKAAVRSFFLLYFNTRAEKHVPCSAKQHTYCFQTNGVCVTDWC